MIILGGLSKTKEDLLGSHWTLRYMIASKCCSFLWNIDNFRLIKVLDSFAALSSQFDPGTASWLPAISRLST